MSRLECITTSNSIASPVSFAVSFYSLTLSSLSLSRARRQSDGNNSRRGKKRVFCFSTRFKKVFKLVHREQRGVLLKERNQKEERERKKRVLFDSIHERGERRDGR